MKTLVAFTTAFALSAATAAPAFAQSTDDDDDDAFLAAASSSAPGSGLDPAAMAVLAGVGLALIVAVSDSSSGTR
ncbi:hypothetical protein [uncultured Pelagimonas sp.]|uniref:hypothetical protein n=1 Tax=uncultured Pelagimonas sp. TaxID=1618102 RepID=UPI002631C05B|nr:hypothetical protein [uncultured Pelagimonas sp.]